MWYNIIEEKPIEKQITGQISIEDVMQEWERKKKESEEKLVKDITFSTKGELKYISVALASCIARYTFLREMGKLKEAYKEDIPFGAAAAVDNFAIKFAKKHGIEELNKITKQNFVNYSNVVSHLK